MRLATSIVLLAGCSAGNVTPEGGKDLSSDLSVAMLSDLGASDGPRPPASQDLSHAVGNVDLAKQSGPDLALVGGSACANPPCLNVSNGCPFPLWIHAANASNTLTPDNAMLAPRATRQYDLPGDWPAARVNASWSDPNGAAPDGNAFDKVEVTFSGGVMNYNITYVDYLALPARIEAVGPSCVKNASFDPVVGCDVPVGAVLSGCPNGLLDDKRCLSAGLFCSIASNQASAFCHALDTPLQSCEAQNGATCGVAQQLGNGTPNVYSCSGYFDSQPPNCSPASTTCHLDGNKWCAALNRGMLAQPTSTDTSLFYKTAPFNAYAKWVHDTCPNIYAFPYDDYPSGAGASGFRACTAARLDITFCPGG